MNQKRVERAPRQLVRHPVWWKPCKFDGVLSKSELDEMANADCRFLDEEEAVDS